MPGVATGVAFCAMTYELGLEEPVPERSIVAKRFTASAVFGFTSNAWAVIVAFVVKPSVTLPAVPSVPTVNEAKVWFVATVREPFVSRVTALSSGNVPVPVSSHTLSARIRVGPFHACGTVKRKPDFLSALAVPIVTPCGSSSGCVSFAWNVMLMESITLRLQSAPARNSAPRVPISPFVTSLLM